MAGCPRKLAATVVALLSVCVAACTSDTAERGDGKASGASNNFVVLSGEGGVALTDGQRLETVPGVAGPSFIQAGPLAVPIGDDTAAVMGAGQLAVVGLHRQPIVKDCQDCAGVALAGGLIVTSRTNFQPGEGFDLVFFRPDLSLDHSVPARRVPERRTIQFPAENTASPITLAAAGDRVTVGYLSKNGGVRAGPSIIAQYSTSGSLLDHVSVDGLIGQSSLSPDGRYLALGVGGSGGACVTSYYLVVVELEGLRVQTVDPAVPAAAQAGAASLSDPWFLMTDLVWDGPVVRATGEVHSPPEGESCDRHPGIWTRSYDPATGAVKDARGKNASARRWIGPDCADVVEAVGGLSDATVVARRGGKESSLGAYSRLALGRPAPATC
jgi:hypothetical protein